MILTVSIHPTAIKVARSGQGGRNVALEMTDATGGTIASIFPGSADGWDDLINLAIEGRVMQEQADTGHAIAADVAGQTATRVPLDVVGDEPPADRVPWPTGLCGHPVPPGAWAAGFTRCRDCMADRAPEMLATFDEAAAPDLTVVDDEDGEQR